MSARPRPLKAALSVFRIVFLESIQYRFAGLTSGMISVFWGLIEIAAYATFFLHGDRALLPGITADMSLSQMVSYVWLCQMLLTLTPNYSIDGAIRKQIDSGDIGVALCRPFHLFDQWFARNAANRVAPAIWRGGFTLAVALLMPAAWRIGPPASAGALLCALASVGCAVLLGAAWSNLLCIIRMNIAWGDGPVSAISVLSSLLTGAYLPLQLWPDFMQTLLLYQPFAGLLDIPIRLYLGLLPIENIWKYGALQLAWSLFFVLVGRLLMRHHLKNIIVQGG